jgi:hypothetical protein
MMPMPMLTVPESWFYRDPQNNVQGPYETASMRQWHEACYFTPELPIKLRHWPVFHPLRAVFPDSETAFSPNTATQEPYQSPPPQMRQGPPGGMCIFICVYVLCVCVYVCLCMCVYINIYV